MTTITINTYDPEGCLNMDKEQAKEFYALVEKKAKEAGYEVEYAEALRVDDFSEEFALRIFEDL